MEENSSIPGTANNPSSPTAEPRDVAQLSRLAPDDDKPSPNASPEFKKYFWAEKEKQDLERKDGKNPKKVSTLHGDNGSGGGGGGGGGDGGDDDDDDDDDDDEPPVKYTYTIKHEDGTSELVEEEWSPEHAKILYLMGLYAKCALTASDNESWIRNIPLVVLIYEGIVAGTIDFDYAPKSVLITANGKSKRVWMNVTQEGKAAVDDLREKDHINGLKLSTEDFQPVTAFQVSHKGLDFLKQVPQEMKNEVDKFLFSPAGNLLKIKFIAGIIKEVAVDAPEAAIGHDDHFHGEGHGEHTAGEADSDDDDDDDDENGQFILVDELSGFERESSCTEAEDVSYVSSPFLPSCVRNPRDQRQFTSNAHRAHESASGEANLRDELDEAITLNYVLTMVS